MYNSETDVDRLFSKGFMTDPIESTTALSKEKEAYVDASRGTLKGVKGARNHHELSPC